jgi:hypothetical protein
MCVLIRVCVRAQVPREVPCAPAGDMASMLGTTDLIGMLLLCECTCMHRKVDDFYCMPARAEYERTRWFKTVWMPVSACTPCCHPHIREKQDDCMRPFQVPPMMRFAAW